MKTIKDHFAKLLRGEDGPSPVEYSVLVTVLVVASLAFITSMQRSTQPYLTRIPVSNIR